MVWENQCCSGGVGRGLGLLPCAISAMGRQEEVKETALECVVLEIWFSHRRLRSLLSAARPSLVDSVLKRVASSYGALNCLHCVVCFTYDIPPNREGQRCSLLRDDEAESQRLSDLTKVTQLPVGTRLVVYTYKALLTGTAQGCLRCLICKNWIRGESPFQFQDTGMLLRDMSRSRQTSQEGKWEFWTPGIRTDHRLWSPGQDISF